MPTERMLIWAAAAIGSDARVTNVRPLHGDEGPWLLGIEHAGGTTAAVLRAPTPGMWPVGPSFIATGAAALEAAERHGLPAPRLISADLDGGETGASTTLETLLPGSTVWPAPPSAERLRAAGAALARLHAVAMTPTEHLPFRPRPIAVDDFSADRRGGRMPTTRLLEEADQLVAAHGLPAGGTVFVHGDVWPGNVIWTEDEAAVLIDWKTAGVGAPGVDLGGLRNQVAIRFVQKPLTLCARVGNAQLARGLKRSPIGTPLPRSTLAPSWTRWTAWERPTAVTRSCARHSQTSGDELTIP